MGIRDRRPEFKQLGITPEDASKDPADYSKECLRHDNRKIHAYLKNRGTAGAEAEKISADLKMKIGTVGGRLAELYHQAYVRKSEAVAGDRAVVWLYNRDLPTEKTDEKTYIVNEIFYSLQGEGARAGTANVFIRFAGCNLTCKVESHGFDCDTEFTSGKKMTAEEIAEEARRVGGPCGAVILTGGEPLLQVDDNLLYCLKEHNYYIAVETNGSLPVPKGIHWVTVSPKVAEHAIQQLQASEVKYVRSVGQGIPKTRVLAEYKFLSPAWGGHTDINLQYCIDLIKEHPEWRLSLQYHKVWSVR